MSGRPEGRRGAIRGGTGAQPGGRGTGAAPAAGRGRGRGVPVAPSNGEEKKKDSPPKGSPPEKFTPPEKSEEDKAATELKLAEIAKQTLCKRPGKGTAGAPFPIRANHFELKLPSQVVVVQQYAVDVIHERRKLVKDERLQVFWIAVAQNKGIFPNPFSVAYDGDHICFATHKIAFPGETKDDYTITVENPDLERDDRKMNCKVRYRLVGNVSLDLGAIRDGLNMSEVQTPIQVIDVIFRQARTCTYMTQPYCLAGRSFYCEPADHRSADLGSGREIWSGFFSSAHLADNWKPLINIDLSNTAYYRQEKVLEFLCDVMGPLESRQQQRPKFVPQNFYPDIFLTPEEKRAFEREIRGLRVMVKHSPRVAREGSDGQQQQGRDYRVYKVNGLHEKGADGISFKRRIKNDDGTDGEREMTVADYFREVYGPLDFPKLQCLHVGSKNKQTYMPMEVCEIKRAQRCNKKLNDVQTSKMIKQVCTDAPTRERQINEQVQKSNLGKDGFVESFGLQVLPQMVQFQARRLNPPMLEYGNGRTTTVSQGEWRLNGLQLFETSTCRSYALVSFMGQNRQRDLERFCQELKRAADGLGVTFPPMPDVVQFCSNAQSFDAAFDHIVSMVEGERAKGKEPPLDLIVVVIPAKNSHLYPMVKRTAEIKVGIMTQCATFKTVSECKNQTMGNLILKINAKLGGINNRIKASPAFEQFFLSEPTLVLGVDVTHPGPLDTRMPSVASMVGNLDLHPNKFAASLKVQKHRREALVYLGDLVKERLMAFYKSTKHKPSRIIVYRDGVSEGQFKQVLLEEMKGIREACTNLEPTYRPKITFIVVQKRHHTRLFCANPRDSSGRAKNVPPGTVVDTTVTHPVNFDFFMVSHQGLLGTSRPTHYHILHDDNGFTADAMQEVTHALTHIFCRCTRSVSIPAPVYYADLACTRARAHLMEKLNEQVSDSGSHSGGGDTSSASDEKEMREAVLLKKDGLIKQDFNQTMYFA